MSKTYSKSKCGFDLSFSATDSGVKQEPRSQGVASSFLSVSCKKSKFFDDHFRSQDCLECVNHTKTIRGTLQEKPLCCETHDDIDNYTTVCILLETLKYEVNN